MFTKFIRYLGGLLGVFFLCLSSTLADKNPPVEILAAYVDFENDTITLFGANFDNGGEPLVSVGQLGPVQVSSYSGGQIVLDFSGGLPADGDYRVVVATGPGSDRSDAYDLTIHADVSGTPPGGGDILERSLSHSGATYPDDDIEAVAIGFEELLPLCGDGDGCMVRLNSRARYSYNNRLVGNASVSMLYLDSGGDWFAVDLTDGARENAQDSNGDTELVAAAPYCYVLDSDSPSTAANFSDLLDQQLGFQLAAASYPDWDSLECYLVVSD